MDRRHGSPLEQRLRTWEQKARLASLVEDSVRISRAIARLEATRAANFADAVALSREMDPEAGRSSASAELSLRSVAAEFGTALTMSDQQIQGRLNDARTLVTEFPATHAAMMAGEITHAHAQVIVRAGVGIDDDAARADYERAAVDSARSTTPGRLRAIVTPLAEDAMPRCLDERHRAAREHRSVMVIDDADGMSTLSAHLPTVIAHGILDRVMTMAREVKRERSASRKATAAGDTSSDVRPDDRDTRSLPQIAADVLSDILLGSAPTTTSDAVSSIRANVQVMIPVTALAGADDRGAILAGVGAVDVETVRRLAGIAPGWDRVFTDAATGHVVAIDRYAPTASMRRTLRVRDEHCRFPGCRRPARRCDTDHTVAWEHGGRTHLDNLAHLCRRHHTLKHHSAWRVENLGSGVLRWTSPLGAEYVDAPPRKVRFATDDRWRVPDPPALAPF